MPINILHKYKQAILCVTFLPFWWKALQYVAIGNPYLAIMAVVITLPIGYACFKDLRWGQKVVMVWAFLLFGYGIARIFLAVMVMNMESGVEAYIIEQANYRHFLESTGFLLLAMLIRYTWKKPSKSHRAKIPMA